MKELTGDDRIGPIQRLANYPLLTETPGPSLTRILDSSRLFTAEAGELLRLDLGPDPFVYFLLKGAVRVYHRLEDGREYTPKVLVAPNHFGDLQLLLGQETRVQSVEVIETAEIATTAWPAVDELLRTDVATCRAWLEGLASQFMFAIDGDRHNVFASLTGRVANVLLSYAQTFSTRTAAGLEFTVPLSRGQIARHVGTAKRCVSRVIKILDETGVIRSTAQEVLVQRPEALGQHLLPNRLGILHRMPSPSDRHAA